MFFLGWLIGVVTLPYQWVRDWWQGRKSGTEEGSGMGNED